MITPPKRTSLKWIMVALALTLVVGCSSASPSPNPSPKPDSNSQIAPSSPAPQTIDTAKELLINFHEPAVHRVG